MRVADDKELRVYKLVFESAMEIFDLSKKFPSEEKFSLTDQIRRPSRSAWTNMAEAWRKRRYEAAFVSKLSDSDGEADETEVHLAFALRCGYLLPDKHAALMDHYDHICRQIRKMMDDAASWCGTAGEVREMAAEYFVEPQHGVGEFQHRSAGAQSKTYAPRSSRSRRFGRSSRSKRPS
jgi:four helix bundle protein